MSSEKSSKLIDAISFTSTSLPEKLNAKDSWKIPMNYKTLNLPQFHIN